MITFSQIGYMGRLGNQMFQFASILGIASKLGLDARFPLENCFNYVVSGPFDPNIGGPMPVKCDLNDCFKISDLYFIPSNHISKSSVYHEKEFGYNKDVEYERDGTDFYGYFQTEKYFSHVRDLILSQFAFKSPYSDRAANYIETIRTGNNDLKIASIHVRRGDYTMYPDHHPPCSRSYYTDAEREIRNRVGNVRFLVFSDDIEWCKAEFVGSEYIICDLKDPYSELCCMSLCDHNIIANSSFSWWGSWLNKNPEKIVIAPSKWFGPAIRKDVSDVYFENVKII